MRAIINLVGLTKHGTSNMPSTVLKNRLGAHSLNWKCSFGCLIHSEELFYRHKKKKLPKLQNLFHNFKTSGWWFSQRTLRFQITTASEFTISPVAGNVAEQSWETSPTWRNSLTSPFREVRPSRHEPQQACQSVRREEETTGVRQGEESVYPPREKWEGEGRNILESYVM